MELNIYQVDAFAHEIFTGNPAAVCPLESWLNDDVMQNIAAENNLAETAFFVKEGTGFHIRWFTPTTEVDLCGHATLASAYVIFEQLNYSNKTIHFESKSGQLSVEKQGDLLQLDFPTQVAIPCETPKALTQAFGKAPIACFENEDYLAIYNEEFIHAAKPDLTLLQTLELRGVIISAESEEYDFVNRVFAPKYGINEDPVTGSAFTKLIPYWANALNKNTLTAKQVSQRGGEVNCQLKGDRVLISGKCKLYLTGKIYI